MTYPRKVRVSIYNDSVSSADGDVPWSKLPTDEIGVNRFTMIVDVDGMAHYNGKPVKNFPSLLQLRPYYGGIDDYYDKSYRKHRWHFYEAESR